MRKHNTKAYLLTQPSTLQSTKKAVQNEIKLCIFQSIEYNLSRVRTRSSPCPPESLWVRNKSFICPQVSEQCSIREILWCGHLYCCFIMSLEDSNATFSSRARRGASSHSYNRL